MTRHERATTWGLLLALAVTLGGCLEGRDTADPTPRAGEEEWYLGGAWTPEYTQDDIDAWCAIAKEHGNECLVMESFPPQYGLRFASEATCREARAKVLALQHITARECARLLPEPNPDEPTSSNASAPPSTDASRWTLHGQFLRGYAAGDIDAWCQLATELGQTCALMKSEPPQFSWTFASEDECRSGRERLGALRGVQADVCVPR